MRNIFVLFLFSIISLTSQAFYGKQAVEATLSFNGRIKLDAGLSMDEIEEKIDQQVQHLLGTFHSYSFKNEFGHPGVIGDTKRYSKIKRKKIKNSDKEIITYIYSSNSVFDKDAFGRKRIISVPIKLPFSLEEIYELGMVNGKNKCTNEKYDSEGDFFYFWDPDKKGCPLIGNYKDVVRVRGKLKRRKSTKKTYPVYNKLFGNNGNGKEIRIDLFFGYIEDEPPKSLTEYLKMLAKVQDDYASMYNVDDALIGAHGVGEFLLNEGFYFAQQKENEDGEVLGNQFKMNFSFKNHEGKKEKVTTQVQTGELFGYASRKELRSLKMKKIQLNEISDDEGGFISELRTYKKKFKSGKTVVINLHITHTDLNSNEEYDQEYFKNAWADSLMNADVVEYEGHSGLGGNLDFFSLYGDERVMNPNKYQVIFINGCSSYPYFRKLFYEHKKKKSNLDLVLSGLSTYSDDATGNSIAFLKSFLNPDKRRRNSFQKILDMIEDSNQEVNGTYLTAITGDTDRNNRRRYRSRRRSK